jgi:hypothetical protein
MDFDEIWPIGIMKDINPGDGLGGYIDGMHRYATIREWTRYASRLARPPLGTILLLTAAAGVVPAGQIYKSVDANGNIVYSDHLDASMSQSTVVQLEDPGLPHELHFCWTNCFTLILDNGAYRRVDGTDESWTVETFSPQAVVLHRHDAPADWNGYSQDVVYAGHVANDRLVGVTVNGKPISGIDASWGNALNTLPGSNAERDAKSPANPNAPSSGSMSAATAPPPLPAEDQPPLPEDGYLWTPGYWSWRDQGYFWISGAWVRPPRVGVLWTPAYWSPAGRVFVFHPGHWGPTVEFYGGINYGYGYFGNGYDGGHWIDNSFAYNSAINHLNPAVAHHTYAGPLGSPAARKDSPHPSLPRPINRPASTAAVQRNSEPPPSPVELNRPTAGVKTPGLAAPAKSNRVMPSRAEPAK